MTRTGVIACVIALCFVTAEAVRPTHFVPKRIAARALLLRSQATPEGAADSLDPALLDDMPRIHPDAVGNLRIARRPDRSFALSGTLADPIDGSAGSAVFLESDGSRLSAPSTRYGADPEPRAFSIVVRPAQIGGIGSHRLLVALISADQRGFFQLPHAVLVRVGR